MAKTNALVDALNDYATYRRNKYLENRQNEALKAIIDGQNSQTPQNAVPQNNFSFQAPTASQIAASLGNGGFYGGNNAANAAPAQGDMTRQQIQAANGVTVGPDGWVDTNMYENGILGDKLMYESMMQNGHSQAAQKYADHANQLRAQAQQNGVTLPAFFQNGANASYADILAYRDGTKLYQPQAPASNQQNGPVPQNSVPGTTQPIQTSGNGQFVFNAPNASQIAQGLRGSGVNDLLYGTNGSYSNMLGSNSQKKKTFLG